MHPLDHLLDHCLRDWPHRTQELHCCQVALYPTKLMAKNRGDLPVGVPLGRLLHDKGGRKPAPIYYAPAAGRTAEVHCGLSDQAQLRGQVAS